MMYQFLSLSSGTEVSGRVATGTSATNAGSSAVCSTATGASAVSTSGVSTSVAATSVVWSGAAMEISSSAILILLVRERGEEFGDGHVHQLIDHGEIGRKGKYREEHHRGGGAHLFPTRPGDAAHLGAKVFDVILHLGRPGHSPLGEISLILLFHLRDRHIFALLLKWQGQRDSNPQRRFWRPLVYR